MAGPRSAIPASGPIASKNDERQNLHVGHWIGWVGVEPAKKIVALIGVVVYLWRPQDISIPTVVCMWLVIGAVVVHYTYLDIFTDSIR